MHSKFVAVLVLLVGLMAAPSTPATHPPSVADDDGFAFSLQATGDFAGNFEPCGCRIPAGGLPRRVGLAKAVLDATGGKAAVLQVDAGRLFAPDHGVGYVSVDDPKLKNEWTLRAADVAGIRAANAALYDLPYLTSQMEVDGYDARAKQYPILDRFISVNAVPASKSLRPFKPYVIEEVASERLGAKPLRVGFIGVTEMPKSGDRVGGYRILDPAKALAEHAKELRAKCDVLVVLAYMDKRSLQSMIEPAVPGVDVIVAANQFPPNKFEGDVDRPVYVFTANQAKGVDEVRFFAAAPGSPRPYGRLSMRHVVLDKGVPSEPAASAFTRDAVKAFRKLPE
jgi:2',3'-cyclic-nucleotide 2'-phosphodiesterase (5'-nucleotidase family)